METWLSSVTFAVFLLSASALLWVYGGFPLLVILWGTLRGKRVQTADVTPRVTLVIAAHNEERSASAKIANCLALDYPADQIEVVFASDGSTDATETIVATNGDPRVRLLRLPRQGKIAALDAAVRAATGDVLVFSDANTHFEATALRKLVRNFGDPTVGGVCGNLQIRRHSVGRQDSSGAGESWYWELDKKMKHLQSRCGSIVAADGAIYAIRRSLYSRPEHTAVTDDFAISTAVVARGFRLVYESEAVAWEPSAGRADLEFARKVRIVNRGLRGVMLRRALLDPRRTGFYAVTLFSHKVLRRVASLSLVTLLVSNALLVRQHPLFAATLIAQLAFYGIAAIGWALRRHSSGRSKLLLAPYYYCLANAAAIAGLCSLVTGRRIERWQPQRSGAGT